MQFRWAIGIALWTMLSGPIFAPPQCATNQARPQPTTSKKPVELVSMQAVQLPLVRR